MIDFVGVDDYLEIHVYGDFQFLYLLLWVEIRRGYKIPWSVISCVWVVS